ncbi:hypothetical protein [Flexithrix dorotheae]|uniref:hypothetical protein n=1 Tax=Flexithrix dorotheae TaxID=70993 RepID=UPI00035FE87E|nr:hypothetical protein [Flexithrix dorotheae]
MSRISFFILLLVLVGLAVVAYSFLGGFKKITINEVEDISIEVVGKEVRGSTQGVDLNKQMYEIRKKLDEDKIEGTFTAIFEGNPDELDTINGFVGVVPKVSKSIPEGFSTKNIKAEKGVIGIMIAHVWVAPNPVEVNNQLMDFAKSKNLSFQDLIIEQYFASDSVVTTILVE